MRNGTRIAYKVRREQTGIVTRSFGSIRIFLARLVFRVDIFWRGGGRWGPLGGVGRVLICLSQKLQVMEAKHIRN